MEHEKRRCIACYTIGSFILTMLILLILDNYLHNGWYGVLKEALFFWVFGGVLYLIVVHARQQL